MSKNYEDIGLDSQLRSTTGLVASKQEYTTGADFDANYDRGVITTTQVAEEAITTDKVYDSLERI